MDRPRAASSSIAESPIIESGSGAALVATPPPPVAATFSINPPALGSTGFGGMSASSLPCYGTPCREPARSGVAVGEYDVVQASSVGFRFTDRSGSGQSFDSTYGDFMQIPTDSFAADGRVVWDAQHRRWLATFVETTCTGVGGPRAWLDVAISESTDPQWFWTWYSIPFGTTLPVRPALGTSADKIVIGVGIDSGNPIGAASGCGFFDNTYPSLTATSLVVIDWATLLGLPATLDFFSASPEAGATPWRPALADPASSVTTDVSAIDFGPASGRPARLATVTGTVAASIAVSVVDLTAAGVLGSTGAPVGPTDLVRRADQLWTVWDDACSSVSGPYGCVRVARVSANGSSQVEDVLIGTAGHNAYNGGIMVAGDGTLHVLYSVEPSGSAFQQVSTWHVEQPAAAAPGAFSKPALIAAGAFAYSGTFPGGYVGLAPDPVDPHAVWQAGEYAGDPGGAWTSWISKLTSGVAATPSGTFMIEAGRPLTHALRIHLSAVAASGTQLRLSNVPTASGGMLSLATTLQPSSDLRWSLSDPTTGGTTAIGPRTVYLQWGDGAGGWSSVMTSQITYSGAPPTIRLAGADRYATAAAIVTSQYKPGVSAVYIATGLNFPDALAGAAAAGHHEDPLLLVTGTTIPEPTKGALGYLKPASIVILGGTGVISDVVRNELAAYTTAGAAGVSRISGKDRYATAAAVSAATYAPGVEMVLIATGLNFPDALAGAAVGGHYGAPLLLVSSTGIPATTALELTRLKPHRIVVLGGDGVVGAAIGAALHGYTDGGVFRVAGATRYDTASEIALTFFAPGPTLLYAATGLNFPDALAGAPLAARLGSPVVLVPAASIPTETGATLTYLASPEINVLGGPGVIAPSVMSALAAYVVP